MPASFWTLERAIAGSSSQLAQVVLPSVGNYGKVFRHCSNVLIA